MESKNPGSRRHALMVAGGFFLLVAGFVEPGLLSHLSNQAGTISMGFIVVCGFLAARGIRQLAAVFLGEKGSPWYTRPGVVIFLCIALPCLNPLFLKLDDFFLGTGLIQQVTTQQARTFLFMAFELLWMAWLD